MTIFKTSSTSVTSSLQSGNSTVGDKYLSGEFSDSGNEESELWITPKLTKPAAKPLQQAKQSTMPSQPPKQSKSKASVAPSALPLAASKDKPQQNGYHQQQQGSQRHSRRRTHRRNGGDSAELKLTGMQMFSWYAPRILFLFLIGWACSVCVQLIHAQQKPLAVTTTSTSPSPAKERPLFGSAKAGSESADAKYASTGILPDQQSRTLADPAAHAPSHEADSEASDSDDSDGEYYYNNYENIFLGWRAGSGRSRAGGRSNGQELFTRDLISRVLQHASWSDGVNGLMTVLVGTAYPYLDYKWRSYPSHKIGWNEVLRCVGGFLGVNYAALKLPFETANQSFLIMIIISLGLWTVCDGTLHGLLLSTSTSLMATWLLYVHALANFDNFTQEDYLGMLSYLPSVLFTYFVMTGSIGRRLGFHPLWKRYRNRELRRQQQEQEQEQARDQDQT